MKLTDIIINALPYLSEFNYDCYTNNYKKFSEDLVPVLSTALLSEVHTAVQDLTDGFDIYYSSLSKKEKKDKPFKFKQVLALFLSPFCLKKGGEFEFFARELNEVWNKTYPKNVYYLTDFDSILKGFDANLLGLPLRKSNKYAK